MTAPAPRVPPSTARILFEMLIGRRPIERSGPFLRTFKHLPPWTRDVVRWILRPKQRFLYGRLRAAADDRVLSGAFVGMQLMGRPAGSELIGTYEREVFPWIAEWCAAPPHTIINIGARHGYYAIGLARLMPNAMVWAFEGDEEAHATLAAAVAANGVAARVSIGGFADDARLAEVLGDGRGVLIVCDIDGGEVPLLDPALIPALTRAELLIECHGPPETPTEPVMLARFSATHTITREEPGVRTPADLPAAVTPWWARRMPATLVELMRERRTPPQSWLRAVPRG
ncbi:MAG: hypothetical protein K2X99_08000 [Gemmatimonadaceae bacterium]|nr:hypothetical protein [Gemmatimonadaceae bacterium]